jgi:ABC-type transport system involved in multi-copper enzyme maturation permease subunit
MTTSQRPTANGWQLSWNGLRTVVELELRQRVRSRRWVWALAAWFVFIGGVTALMIFATERITREASNAGEVAGPIAFAVITFFVLGMGLLIAPTFTATSINGDRNSGTLAILQATRLSALEIATGKLVAAWLTSAVFLVVALPFILWSMFLGNISVFQVVVCFAVVFTLVAVVCAIGLGWSALISRAAGSTVLTYLSVAGLTVLCSGVMVLLVPLVQHQEVVRVWGLSSADQAAFEAELDRYWAKNPDGDASGAPTPPIGRCAWHDQIETVTHHERIWWLTAINPFVIVSDAAPLPPSARVDEHSTEAELRRASPLAALGIAVRQLGQAPAGERDDCVTLYSSSGGYDVDYDAAGSPTVTTTSGTPVNIESPVKRQVVDLSHPIWPWGLGANVVIGALFFWIAVQRLRVPYRRLTNGTRVA